MATLNAVNPRWVENTTGHVMSYQNVLADASATWVAGEFVRTDNGGLAYEATSGAASGVGADAINYVARDDQAAQLGDTTTCVLLPIHADDVFMMNELDGTVTRAMIGNSYDLDVTSNVCTIDTSSSSNAVLTVVEPKWAVETLENDSADIKARVFVKILGTALNATKV